MLNVFVDIFAQSPVDYDVDDVCMRVCLRVCVFGCSIWFGSHMA